MNKERYFIIKEDFKNYEIGEVITLSYANRHLFSDVELTLGDNWDSLGEITELVYNTINEKNNSIDKLEDEVDDLKYEKNDFEDKIDDLEKEINELTERLD